MEVICMLAGIALLASPLLDKQAQILENKAQRHLEQSVTRSRITFKDVAGSIPPELLKIVAVKKLLPAREKTNVPRRILLVGPSRSGKTFLIEALMGELDADGFHIIGFENEQNIKKTGELFKRHMAISTQKITVLSLSDECMHRSDAVFFTHETLSSFFTDAENLIVIAQTTNEQYDEKFIADHFDLVIKLDNSNDEQQSAFIHFFLSKLAGDEYINARNQEKKDELVKKLVDKARSLKNLDAECWKWIIRSALQRTKIYDMGKLTNEIILEEANKELEKLKKFKVN